MTRLYDISATKPSANVHFDWLTLVFPLPDETDRQGFTPVEWIGQRLDDLYLSDLAFTRMKHGLYTYDFAETAGNNSIIVAWSNKSTTWMLQMSGAGVETLESILANNSEVVAGFVKLANSMGATYSRVDACCNFFNYPKELSAKYAGLEAKKGNLVTNARSVKIIHSFSSQGEKHGLETYQGTPEGYTTYVGHNPKMLRIYNKLAERSEKVNLRYQVKSWSRWEFQLNGKFAQAYIDAYVNRGYDMVQTWVDWLASNYRFIEKVGHQVRRSRYPNATWYDSIIKNAHDKIVVRSEKQKPTFERSAKWIDKQVIPTMADMYFARLAKYVQNGVSYEDAESLALTKIKNDIETVAVNQNVNWGRVTAYVAEQTEAENARKKGKQIKKEVIKQFHDLGE